MSALRSLNGPVNRPDNTGFRRARRALAIIVLLVSLVTLAVLAVLALVGWISAGGSGAGLPGQTVGRAVVTSGTPTPRPAKAVGTAATAPRIRIAVPAGHGQPPTGPPASHVPQPLRRPGGAPILLVVPRLAVRAPVHEGGIDAQGHLRIAPGYSVTHLSISPAPGSLGNAVYYGHDDIQGSVFKDLPTLRVGDPVYLTREARRYLYRVIWTRVVTPLNTSVLMPTSGRMLTLISCVPFGIDSERIVVRARLEGIY